MRKINMFWAVLFISVGVLSSDTESIFTQNEMKAKKIN